MSLTLAGDQTTTNGGMTNDNYRMEGEGEAFLNNLNLYDSEVTPIGDANPEIHGVKREIKSLKSGSVANSEQKLKYERMLDHLKMSDIKNSQLNLIDAKVELKDSFIKEKCENSILLDGVKVKLNDPSSLNQNTHSLAARCHPDLFSHLQPF